MIRSVSSRNPDKKYQIIRKNIEGTFSEVSGIAAKEDITLRKAAMVASAQRLEETMGGRGWI